MKASYSPSFFKPSETFSEALDMPPPKLLKSFPTPLIVLHPMRVIVNAVPMSTKISFFICSPPMFSCFFVEIGVPTTFIFIRKTSGLSIILNKHKSHNFFSLGILALRC